MVNQTILALVHEFDGVFHGDDMVAAIFVRIIHHGGQGRGFAGAGRPGDDDQAAVEHGKLLQYRGQRGVEFLKILEGKHLAWNLAEHGGDAVLLVEEIGAEAGDVRDFVTEIHVAGFLEHLDLVLGGDFVEHLFKLVVVERGMVHPAELAVDAEHRVVVRGKVQVRGLLLEHQVEERVNLRHKICIVSDY